MADHIVKINTDANNLSFIPKTAIVNESKEKFLSDRKGTEAGLGVNNLILDGKFVINNIDTGDVADVDINGSSGQLQVVDFGQIVTQHYYGIKPVSFDPVAGYRKSTDRGVTWSSFTGLGSGGGGVTIEEVQALLDSRGETQAFTYLVLTEDDQVLTIPAADKIQVTFNQYKQHVYNIVRDGDNRIISVSITGSKIGDKLLIDGTTNVNVNTVVDGNSKAPLHVALTDELTPLTVSNALLTMRLYRDLTPIKIKASLTTAQATGVPITIDVKANGVSILTTLLTFNNTETTTVSASVPAVLKGTKLLDDTELVFSITQVGDGTATGLKLFIGEV